MSSTLLRKRFCWVASLSLAILCINVLSILLIHSQPVRECLSDLAGVFSGALAATGCFVAARAFPPKARLSRMWFLFGLAYGSWTMGTFLWTLYQVYLGLPPFPSPADFFYLGCYPLFFLGLLSAPRVSGSRNENAKLGLDTGAAMVAGILVFVSLIVAPLEELVSSALLATLLSAIYPAANLGLLWALLALLIQRNPLRDSGTTILLIGSVINIIAAGWVFGYRQLMGTYMSGGFLDLLFTISMLLGALASFRMADVAARIAWQPEESEAGIPAIGDAFFLRRYLPNILIALTLLAIAWYPVARLSSRISFLLIGSLLFVTLVFMRQMLTLRENQTLYESLRQTSHGLEERTAELQEANARLQIEIEERHRTEVERKAFTEKMQQIQKLESLGVLAGGIAHDFNNLLTVIMGNNEMAGDLIAPGHPAHPFLRELEKATLRAAGLTNQMLAYSGKGAFTLTPVDLNALTREMATLLHASISKKAVLKFEFEEALPAIEGDPSQLSQVILNLITNASEAIEPGTGTITLRTGLMSVDEPFLSNTALPDPLPTGRYLFLEVSDTGTGMNEETRARIFEPFFTTKFTGRGLGLSATLGIIRGHKGSIRVWSEPGKGTRFTLIFPPCGEREKGDKTGPVSARPPEANATVLVVDDEDLVRGVVRRLLQQEGFNTLEACNGQEAIETVAREGAGLDAIVLDLMMPVMGGEEAFQEIRRLHPGLPILVVSGFAGNALAARFETKAATVFLQKPFTGNDLTEALSRAMEGRIPRS